MTVSAPGTHTEKLRTEQRQCPQCGYVITNPMTDRCPRCFHQVARVETDCGSCTWQGNCEFAHLVHGAKNNRTYNE